MATFTENGRDNFGSDLLFTPNVNLLNSALASRQAGYDRGYAAVRGLRDSLINGELTNAENRNFRTKQMAKISKEIGELSNADLSRSENVKKGMGLFDPLVKDKELMHDFAMTRYMRSEMGRAEQYKNSIDPEQRKRYNSESVELMQLRMMDLANAKRGKNEIQSIQPASFVPREDIHKYLSDLAKAEGLEIKGTELSGMYIVETKNGKQAEIPFTEWAMQRIQGGFDQQFRVSAELRKEKTVRGIMQTDGVSREQALSMLGEELKQNTLISGEKRIRDLKATGERIRQKLAQYEKYGANIPEEEQGRYDQLSRELEMIEGFASNERSNLNNLEAQGAEYFAQNFTHHLKNEIQTNTASGWAKTHAQLTSEVDIKPDQVGLTVFRENNANQRMLAKFKHDREQTLFSAQLDSQKMERQHQLDIALDNFETQNDILLHSEKAKIDAQYVVDPVTGKRKKPLIEDIGAYTNAEQDVTAYDVAQKAQEKTIGHLGALVSGSGGLIEHVFEGIPEKQNLYLQATESIQTVIDNGGDFSVLSPENMSAVRAVLEENGILEDYAGSKHGTLNRNNQAYWQDMMMNVAYKIRDKFENMPVDETMNTYSEGLRKAEASARFDNLLGSYEKNNTVMQNGIKALFEDGGLLEGEDLKDYFETVKKGDGETLYYPKSDLPATVRTALSNLVPSEYKAQERVTGRSLMMNEVPVSIIESLRSGNEVLKIQQIATNGSRTEVELDELPDEEFMGLNPTVLQERYGNNMKVNIDPSTQQVTFEFLPTGAKENGEDGTTKGYAFTVPFSKAKKMNSQIASQVQRYENEVISLSPMGRKIMDRIKPGAKAVNITPSIYATRGIEVDVRRTTKSTLNDAGQYEDRPVLKITSRTQDPITKRWSTSTAEMPVVGRNDVEIANDVERFIHNFGQSKLKEFDAIIKEERRRKAIQKLQQEQSQNS